MSRTAPFWSSSLALALALATATVACGGNSSGSSSSETAAPASGGPRVDASAAGSIKGRVLFEGTPRDGAVLNTSGDARCAGLGRVVRDESVVVHDGGLENVLVYIKDGLGDYTFDVPSEPAKLDQDGCVYTPHVLGVRAGQPLEVTNSDPTAHNVHAAAKVNRQLNTAQPFKGMTYTHRFGRREIAIPFKCDIHPWMTAYVAVVEHPYFAVSKGGGLFELSGVPPGTYRVEAWHEKLGVRTATVTLAARESKELSFTFTTT